MHTPRKLSASSPFLSCSFPHVPRRSSRDHSAVRIALVKDDLYLVHGAKGIAELFRTPSLSVPLAYSIALIYCFGIAQKAVNVYLADSPGSQLKTIEGSDVKPQNRVYYRTHESLLQRLLGPGLAPVSDLFESLLTHSLRSLSITEEWMTFPDLREILEDNLGAVVLESIFGPVLLSQNPGFVRDLWSFDRVVMSLAKRLPVFCIPASQTQLLQSIKKWHALARTHSNEVEITQDEDSDPLWGCKMIRDRFRMLLDVENQDYDSVASTNLGLICICLNH